MNPEYGFTNMKNKGSTLLVIGLMFTTLGLTVLSEYTYLQYGAFVFGLVIMIYSVFETQKQKKNQSKVVEKDSVESRNSATP